MPDLPLTGVSYQYNGRDAHKRLLIAEKKQNGRRCCAEDKPNDF